MSEQQKKQKKNNYISLPEWQEFCERVQAPIQEQEPVQFSPNSHQATTAQVQSPSFQINVQKQEDFPIPEQDLPEKSTTASYLLNPITIVTFIFISICLVFLRPFYVPSGSMLPTIHEGDRILTVASYLKDGHTFKAGDIVCFAPKGDRSNTFVKRIVACGGDTVQFSWGVLYVNGKISPYNLQSDEYLNSGDIGENNPIKLKDDEYFVLGDNRSNSMDSRFTGTVKASWIKSKMVGVYFPFNRFTFDVSGSDEFLLEKSGGEG